MSPLKRFLRSAATVFALTTVLPMCSDLTGPGGANDVIVVNVMSPTVDIIAGAAILIVGDTIHPTVDITVGGTTQPRARFMIRSLNLRTDVVTFDATGTVINVVGRGTDTLVVSAVGATINPELSNKTADTIAIVAKPANNVINVDPARTTLKSINETVLLRAVSKGKNSEAVAGASVVWSSSDSTIADISSSTVSSPDSSVVTITAKRRGQATITAVFEGVDAKTQVIDVAPAVASYQFAVAPGSNPTTPAGQPITQYTFKSKGEVVRVVPTPIDALGTPVASPPAAVFSTTASSGVLTLDPNTGVATAVDNTPVGQPVTIGIVNFPQTLTVVVKQEARSITILGPRTIDIAAPTLGTTLSATALDSLGNTIPTSSETVWSSGTGSVADVDQSGKITTFARGTSIIGVRRDGARDSVTVNVAQDPKTLTLTPKPLALGSVSATAQATARAFDAAGTELAGQAVTWTSLNPAVASVSSSGLVTAAAVGTTRIAATTTVGTATDTLTVAVTNNPSAVSITPSTVTLASIGDTLVPPVDFRNALNAPLPRNSVIWEVRTPDPGVARVTLDGLGGIVALTKGETQVIAKSADGAADTVGVIVTNAPATVVMNRTNDNLTALSQTLQYSADVFNARGALILGAQLQAEPVTFRSTDASVASVNTSGVATALSVGTTLIIAEIGGSSTGLRADTATLTVSNSAVAASVTPGSANITSVGNTLPLSASATNNAGGAVVGQTFNWSSSDNAVATVSSTGLVTATGTGTVTITASIPSSTVSATSTITVTNLPSTINILSADTTLASVGDSYTPGVDFKNAANTALPITSALWTSDDPGIVSVTSGGVITAVAAGSTKIRATNASNAAITDFITVTVSNAAASVTLTPGGPETLTSIGQTLNLSTTVLNQAGQPLANPNVTFSVITGSSVTVTPSGVGTAIVTAVSNGAAQVRATSGLVSDVIDITVAQTISATQSTVTSLDPSLVANGSSSTTISVQLKDANGNNYVGAPVTPTFTTSLGTLDPTTNNPSAGRYTKVLTAGQAAGSGTVTASAGGVGIANQAIVPFTPGPETKWLVTSTNFTPTAGTQVTISAQLADQFGNAVQLGSRTVNWSATGGGCFGVGCTPTGSSTTNGSGVATISFTTSSTASSHTITAVDNGAPSITGATQSPVVGQPSAATRFIVTASSTTPGVNSDVTITAQLVDGNLPTPNPVATAGLTVNWTKSDLVNGTLTASSTTDQNGRAVATFHTHTVAGTASTVTATSGGFNGTSGSITTVPGSAARILMVTQPSTPVTAGVAFGTQPRVEITDANNNRVTSDNSTIVSVARGSGSGSLQGSLTATASSGLVTFSGLTHPVATTITLVFSSGSLTPVSSNSVVVNASATASAALTTANVPAGTAGTVTSISVQARDANGNNLTASGGTLLASITGANTATGSVTDHANGTYTVTYTPTAVGTDAIAITLGGTPVGGSPYSSVVGPGALSNFLVETLGGGAIGSQTAGTPVNIRIVARDANNNTVTGFHSTGNTVNISSASGTLSAGSGTTATFTNGVLASHAVTFSNTGTFTITATRTSGGGQNGTSNTFSVAPGAANAANSTATVPASFTAGSLVTITVQAKDGNSPANNRVSTSGTVTASVAGSNAGKTVTVVDNLDGTYTLTYTPTSAGSDDVTINLGGAQISGSPFTRTVNPAAVHHFLVEAAGGGAIGSQAAGTSFNIQVTAQDINNNTVTGFTSTGNTVNITSPSGTLSAGSGTTATFTNGVLASHAVTFSNTGTFTITATRTSGGAQSGTSASFAVVAGAAHHLNFVQQPTSAVATVTISPAVTVEVVDLNNNRRTADNATQISLVIGTNPGGGALSGTISSVTVSNGLATFSNLSIDKVGTGYTLAATSSVTGTTSSTFNITVGAAHHLTFTQQPATTAGGATMANVVVAVQDAGGNTRTADNATSITLAIANNAGTPAGTLSGTTNLTVASGVATFSTLSIDKIGTGYTLAATSSPAVTGATSSAFNITLGTATKLGFLQQPTNAAATASITPAVTVAVQDAGGNTVTSDGTTGVTLSIASNPGAGTLTGGGSTTVIGGIATFSGLSINRSGNGYTLTATPSTAIATATSSSFNITGSTATKYLVTTTPAAPTNVVAGTSVTVTAQLADANNNPVLTAGKTVSWSKSGAGGSFTTPTSLTDASGIATVTFTVGTVATTVHAITATDNTSLTGTSGNLTVIPDVANRLGFLQHPTNRAAGATITPAVTVAVQDQFGNTITTDNTTTIGLVIGTNPGGGALTGGTAVAVASGVATFAGLSIDKTGTGYTLTAASTPSFTGATSSTFNITPNTATHLAFVQQPTSAAATASLSPAVTVAILDANNNVVTTDNTTTITLSIANNAGTPAGTLSGSFTNAAVVSGVATFSNLSIDKIGTGYTLAATSNPAVTGATSSAFNITLGAAHHLTFTQQPTTTVAGATMSPAVTVAVQDAGGNTRTGDNATTITLAIASNAGNPAGTLSGTVTNVQVAAGVATFSDLSIDRTGAGYTLAATSNPVVTGATSSAFNITVGTADHLAFVQQPTNAVATQTISPAVTVAVLDANNNVVTTDNATTITLAINANPGTGTLSGSFTNVAVVNGVATFSNLSIDKVGTGYTLDATSNPVVTGATSSAFNITVGAAHHLTFTQQPATTAGGATMANVVVAVQDAGGNTRTGDNATQITLSIANNVGTPAGTLSGSFTNVAVVSGVATFSNLSIDKIGTGYTLAATSNPAVTGATSSAFNITLGTATKLGFLQQPTNTVAGASVTPAITVAVQDAGGNTVTTDGTTTVSLAIGTNPGAGTLSGSVTNVTVVAGVATFSNASINKTGTGYTLAATSSPALTGATSSAFNITPGVATKYLVTSASSSVVSGASVLVTAQLADANNNAVSTSGKSVVWSKTCDPANPCAGDVTGGSFIVPSSITDASGQAVISLSVSTNASLSHTVTATDNTALTGTSASIDVIPGTFARLQLLVAGETAAPGTASGKTGTPTTRTAGTQFSVTANGVDANWNVVPSATDNIQITSTDPDATLPANNTLLSGTRNFDITLNTAGAFTITATDLTNGGITANTSPSITVNPGAYNQLQVLLPGETADPGSATGKTGTPSTRTAGSAFAVTVNAVDSRFNVVNSITESVAVTTSDPNDTHPASSALAAGTRNFSVTFTTAGTWNVSATGTPSTNNGTSASVLTDPGAFAKLQLLVPGESAAPGTTTGKSGTPTARTAGSSFSVTVNGVDANWNVVPSATDNIQITSTDPDATLPANNTLASGTRNFTVTLNTAGSFTITATDLTNGTITANTSPAITVDAGAFSQLQILLPGETADPGSATGKTGSPSAQTAAGQFSVTVKAVDSRYNLINTVVDNVAITSSDPDATLPANAALVAGTMSFNVTLNTAGSWTVTADDLDNGAIANGVSASVSVNPGTFSQLQVLLPGETADPGSATGKTGSTTNQTAAAQFTITVNAVDSRYNLINTVTDNVSVTSSDQNDVNPSNAALVAGTKTFDVTMLTAGAQTITADDLDNGGIADGVSAAVTIDPGAYDHILVLVPNETQVAGTLTGKTGTVADQATTVAFTVTVKAVDLYNNTIPGITESVALTSGTDIGFTATAQTFALGSATFADATFANASVAHTITATGSPSSKTGDSSAINVAAELALSLLNPFLAMAR